METLEDRYLAQVGFEHRKNFAQFFTPRPIADFMRTWIMGGKKTCELFDPAFGLGAFFADASEDLTARGIELDPEVLVFYLSHSSKKKKEVIQGNYLLEFDRHYDNIICNPPYLKFQRFDQKEAVLEAFQKKFGIRLSGYTNIASAFLVKSIFELNEGGRLAYIMPVEFLNAGYGIQIKELLLQTRHLACILQLSCEQEAFPEATTSLCILLYDSGKSFSDLSFYSVDELSQLNDVLNTQPTRKISYDNLNPNEKWSIYFKSLENCVQLNEKSLVPLSIYGHFSRGIATGANEFFVLRQSDVSRLALQEKEYAACITKSAQIVRSVFTQSDFNLLVSKDAPVYLLNASTELSLAAQKYIRYGEIQGFNQRYITRNRTPWYKMERRAAAPIMLNVFSRNGYKAVRNYSLVQSLTPFHCFYPSLFGAGRMDLLFLFLYSRVGHSILGASVRKYGNKLEKFEPNDLNRSLVPSEEFLDGVLSHHVTHLMNRLSDGEDIQDEADLLFKGLLVS